MPAYIEASQELLSSGFLKVGTGSSAEYGFER